MVDRKNHEAILLYKLGDLSKNIAQYHYVENLAEFLLHELCHEQQFNITKAAYLVHNPDFACLKGIAGFNKPEAFGSAHWQDKKAFTNHMKQSGFNQKVRGYVQERVDSKALQSNYIRQVADSLEIEKPAYHTWASKHNNQGIFIFQDPLNASKDHLYNFLPMLSFCPIF